MSVDGESNMRPPRISLNDGSSLAAAGAKAIRPRGIAFGRRLLAWCARPDSKITYQSGVFVCASI